MILTAVVALTAVVTISGTASAAVVVPPGGSGSTCSSYDHVTGHPELYWQTCAWADNNEVYFTVHFGNSGGVTWRVDTTSLDSYSSGQFVSCPKGLWRSADGDPIVVLAHSINQTPTSTCAQQRRRGAYAARAVVSEGTYFKELVSPTLQVQ
jgi:hypothetical protein